MRQLRWYNQNPVETVVQLVRKKPDTYINVKLDLDELDLTSAEAKATYKEIRNYIREEHGVNVTSLEIAQMQNLVFSLWRNWERRDSICEKQKNCFQMLNSLQK